MAFVHVQCPDGHRTDVGQYGQHAHGTQRSRGNHRDGPRTLCLLPYQDKGRLPGNLVNISVTSVDTSADCASGRGLRARTATLAELPIVCTPMRGGMVVGVAPWAQLGLPWCGRWAEPSPREGDVCLPR